MQKKWVIGITAVTLAAATAIGSTLAYFTATTKQMTNSFTVKAPNGISGQLRESKWDGFDFGQYVNGNDPDGKQHNTNNPVVPPENQGLTKAETVMPGIQIDKNPTLMNTTNWDFTNTTSGNPKGALKSNTQSVPVYMAIKVTYNNFNDKIEKINGNGSINVGWQDITPTGYPSNEKVYMWCDKTADKTNTDPAKVASGDPTGSLFDTIVIDKTATYIDGNQSTDLKAFSIDLKGAAVQADNLTDITEIKTQLTDLLP